MTHAHYTRFNSKRNIKERDCVDIGNVNIQTKVVSTLSKQTPNKSDEKNLKTVDCHDNASDGKKVMTSSSVMSRSTELDV